jgi:oligopeptide transport system substrate-binding protein
MTLRSRERRWAMLALLLALALIAAACSGGGGTEEEGGDTAASEEPADDASEGDSEDGEAVTGGEYSVFVTEPSYLQPPNCVESECSQVMVGLFTGLTEYAVEDGAVSFGADVADAMAEDITTEDNQNYTITLKDGWTFHDGTPVTAQSYVDAWNWAANANNATEGASFFAGIAGFDDLQCGETPEGEADCEGSPPAAEEMSGLTVVDDLTFEVELTEPSIEFTNYVGYTVFMPLPEVFFEDPAAFNEEPVGNGPYQIAAPWEHNVAIQTERFEEYAGDAGNADAIEFRIYDSSDTAYNDLVAGNLDVLDIIPPAQWPTAQDTLGERAIEQPSSSYNFLGFPLYNERFANVDVRRALSMAVPREEIAEVIFNGTRSPATSYISPVVEGHTEGSCGEWCEFDPEAAAELYASAGGSTEPMTVYFNSGAGHEDWIQAVANSWQQNLGITEVTFEPLDFAPLLELYRGRTDLTGPYRLGWSFDYPSAENYLTPLFETDASSNYSTYSNEEFDALMAEGRAAATREEAIEIYQEAEALVFEDLPQIPVFTQNLTAGHSENVENVIFDVQSRLQVADVEVASGG